jgi:low affinity Fe/Cu permease
VSASAMIGGHSQTIAGASNQSSSVESSGVTIVTADDPEFGTVIDRKIQHRDTQAIHTKDELLRAEGRTRSELTRLDIEEPEAIEQRRLKEHGADTQA